MADDIVIETRKLTKTFGSLVAVNEIDLAVHRGEIFGLLGPNGAGKTTTIGMLTTRVVPTGGHALINGVDVVANPVLAKEIVGVVSQQNTLDRSLNVIENLIFHGRYFGMKAKASKETAEKLLDQFRLSDRANDGVDSLSGGMAQRLMVARAIMHNPQILFLDEPTAGLDPQTRLALWEILGELNKAGQTIVLTTHYMEEADQLSNRLAIMDHGRILALDTPQNLKSSVGAETELRLTPTDGNVETLEKAVSTLDGVTKARSIEGTVRVELSVDAGRMLPRIFSHLDAAGISVSDVGISEPSLETVFINLTGKDLRE